MPVVQRCPNCGTTQPTAGACDACHEARVRSFCTNHTPGLWLDSPACPQCAARSAPPGPAPAPTPARRVPTSVPPAPPPRARLPSPVPTFDPAELRRQLWGKLLRAAVHGRGAASRERDLLRPTIARGLGGCLMRLVLLVVLLVVALVGALFFFGRSLL